MHKTPTVNKNQEKPEETFWHPGAVVGTVHTEGGIKVAGKLSPGSLAAVELRLDCLAPSMAQLRRMRLPVILTPRDFTEGGSREWSACARMEEAFPLLEAAAAVDVELSQAEKMRELLLCCRKKKVPVILSFHDFVRTPTAAKLRDLQSAARDAGATIFKVATTLRQPGDIHPLLKLLERSGELPVAVMGMGAWGRASRVYLGAAGSVLNYGWLHRPQVSGQWPAGRLQALLSAARH